MSSYKKANGRHSKNTKGYGEKDSRGKKNGKIRHEEVRKKTNVVDVGYVIKKKKIQIRIQGI